MAGELRHGRVVGEVVPAFRPGAPMGVEDQVEAEGLGRLHRAQAAALRRADDSSVGPDLLDGVGDRQAGDGGAMPLGAGDGPADQVGGGERTGPIMDQHDVGPVRGLLGQRLEPVADAMLPRAATVGGPAQAVAQRLGKAGGGSGIELFVVGMDHRRDQHRGVGPQQGMQRMRQHRLAADVAELLG